jgi:RNA polymerase sigma-70 factor (ECF subfamily)
MSDERGPASAARTLGDPTDAELVLRGRTGDAFALEALIRRHYRTAFAVAMAHSRSKADAEDVCQDALGRAAERLDDCRNPDRFVQWLCVIVRNHARNVLARGFWRRATETLEHGTAASADDPARAVELQELRARLESALRRLSPIQREVVLLHDLDGCGHDVIANIIGTSIGMSRQHLFHGRRRLREALGAGIVSEYIDD